MLTTRSRRIVIAAALGLAMLGVVLPGLPTTPFVLVAAWALAHRLTRRTAAPELILNRIPPNVATSAPTTGISPYLLRVTSERRCVPPSS